MKERDYKTSKRLRLNFKNGKIYKGTSLSLIKKVDVCLFYSRFPTAAIYSNIWIFVNVTDNTYECIIVESKNCEELMSDMLRFYDNGCRK